MDREQLKHRIVGAIVLVALGVIFIPMIFSDDQDPSVNINRTNIPDKPGELSQLREVTIPAAEPLPPHNIEPRRIVTESKAGNKKTTAADNKTAADKDKQVTTSATKQKTPSVTAKVSATPKPALSWVVQVASLRRHKSALALQRKLRKGNFEAFVEAVKTDKGEIYRVRVGPELKREDAQRLQQQIVKQYKLKGVVMRHP